jgi:nucleotide-binding universal stress UspA family protein
MVAISAFGEQIKFLPIGLLPTLESKNHKKLLLVPFEITNWSPGLLDSAVSMAERSDAEIVLLCVRPPSETRHETQEEERHFSALKSLQAQVHHRAVPVSIRTVVGPVAQSVLDYAEQNATNMILVSSPQTAVDKGNPETLRA